MSGMGVEARVCAGEAEGAVAVGKGGVLLDHAGGPGGWRTLS